MFLKDFTVYQILFLGLVMGLEFYLSRIRKLDNFEWTETLSSFCIRGMMYVMSTFYAETFTLFFAWFWKNRLLSFDKGPLILVVAYLIAAEFLYYWSHRFSHSYAIGWANHATHHTLQRFNIANGMRGGTTGPFALYYFFPIPFYVLGFHPELLTFYTLMNLMYQQLLHTELIGKLGFLEGILNTPSAHRVHHGTQEIYRNKNFGGMTVIFDRMFGTYQSELEEVKPKYGLISGVPSQNPLRLALIGWEQMFRSLFFKY